MEMTMTSVERVQEYIELPQEAPPVIPSRRPPSKWPTNGHVLAKDLTIRYAPDLPPAVSLPGEFRIRPGERVGIVGRTGSGKTTLGMSLLRLLEPESGSLTVDDIDIGEIGLRDLRHGIVAVPQDAFLFKATLRQNLDPMASYADSTLESALELLGLTSASSSSSSSLTLDMPIAEGGSNLSGGQRQLVSLARALIRGEHKRLPSGGGGG
ncbi:hypothetical protein HK101_010970, partial [Irineochytrium annulatum]